VSEREEKTLKNLHKKILSKNNRGGELTFLSAKVFLLDLRVKMKFSYLNYITRRVRQAKKEFVLF
jgi:hypothetical protein